MKKKTRAIAKVNDVFMHLEEKKPFVVSDIVLQPKGRLYTLKEMSGSESVTYKRYYEDKLKSNCEKIKNSKAVKILYGKKK
jgi:hypothetical protein